MQANYVPFSTLLMPLLAFVTACGAPTNEPTAAEKALDQLQEKYDALTDGVAYIDDSAQPRALESVNRLRWGRSILPSSGLTLTYRVRPERAG